MILNDMEPSPSPAPDTLCSLITIDRKRWLKEDRRFSNDVARRGRQRKKRTQTKTGRKENKIKDEDDAGEDAECMAK